MLRETMPLVLRGLPFCIAKQIWRNRENDTVEIEYNEKAIKVDFDYYVFDCEVEYSFMSGRKHESWIIIDSKIIAHYESQECYDDGFTKENKFFIDISDKYFPSGARYKTKVFRHGGMKWYLDYTYDSHESNSAWIPVDFDDNIPF